MAMTIFAQCASRIIAITASHFLKITFKNINFQLHFFLVTLSHGGLTITVHLRISIRCTVVFKEVDSAIPYRKM